MRPTRSAATLTAACAMMSCVAMIPMTGQAQKSRATVAAPAKTEQGKADPSAGEPGKTEAPKPPAPPSTSVALTIDNKTTKMSVAALQALPQKTVTVHNEHTKADESYTGVLLSDLLTKVGFVVDKTTHQRMLRSYILAEGTDKYWVVYSLTEIEGTEHNGDVLVATSMDGKPLGPDGQFKLIDSEDKKPQRWVRNLMAIRVRAASVTE